MRQRPTIFDAEEVIRKDYPLKLPDRRYLTLFNTPEISQFRGVQEALDDEAERRHNAEIERLDIQRTARQMEVSVPGMEHVAAELQRQSQSHGALLQAIGGLRTSHEQALRGMQEETTAEFARLEAARLAEANRARMAEAEIVGVRDVTLGLRDMLGQLAEQQGKVQTVQNIDNSVTNHHHTNTQNIDMRSVQNEMMNMMHTHAAQFGAFMEQQKLSNDEFMNVLRTYVMTLHSQQPLANPVQVSASSGPPPPPGAGGVARGRRRSISTGDDMDAEATSSNMGPPAPPPNPPAPAPMPVPTVPAVVPTFRISTPSPGHQRSKTPRPRRTKPEPPKKSEPQPEPPKKPEPQPEPPKPAAAQPAAASDALPSAVPKTAARPPASAIRPRALPKAAPKAAAKRGATQAAPKQKARVNLPWTTGMAPPEAIPTARAATKSPAPKARARTATASPAPKAKQPKLTIDPASIPVPDSMISPPGPGGGAPEKPSGKGERLPKRGKGKGINARAVAAGIGKDSKAAAPRPKSQARNKVPQAAPPVKKLQIKTVSIEEPATKDGAMKSARAKSAPPRRNRMTKKQLAELEASLGVA